MSLLRLSVSLVFRQKYALLNMIGRAGTLPTSGKVFIDGKDIFSMKERNLTVFRRRNIGFIYQSFNLIPELTVEQNIIFPVLLDYQKPKQKVSGRTADGAGPAKNAAAICPASFPAASSSVGSDRPRTDYPPGPDPGRRANRQTGTPKIPVR